MESKQTESYDPKIREIIQRSLKAREYAYCPYSKFKVGASALYEDGSIYDGCNVENASYCIGICAERTAIVKAVSEGKKNIVAIAVAASLGDSFVTPCGSCRQFILEFSDNVDIYLVRIDGNVKKSSIKELLPLAFTPREFGRIQSQL